MMIATNWGVFEIGERAQEFIGEDDTRELQVRARSGEHLRALRDRVAGLGESIYLDGIADFPWRAYISRADLGAGLATLVDELDYERFKEGAQNDHKLHALLSRMWSDWLQAYPHGSRYTSHTVDPLPVRVVSEQFVTRNSLVQDLDTIELESEDFGWEEALQDFIRNTNVTVKRTSRYSVIAFTGELYELFTLVERFETGDWTISMDQLTEDHVIAAQSIDQYIV